MVEYPVVFWRRPPFARTGRLSASGYWVLTKYLGIYGLNWFNAELTRRGTGWDRDLRKREETGTVPNVAVDITDLA